MGNRIGFANTILKNEKIIKGKPRVYDSLSKYKKMGSYDILKDRGEHVTLFQLMYSLVNGNRDISVFGYWIFDSNYKKAIVINKESLGMICVLSIVE